jgi:hypothetical protein
MRKLLPTGFTAEHAETAEKKVKNPKSENRNTKQIQNPNVRMTKTMGISRFGNLKFWKFGFVSDFEIRASNFNIISANSAVSVVIVCLMLMTCFVFAVSPSEKQQLDNFKVSTLKGLRGVSVSVKIVRDNPDTLSLLKETQLAGIAEMTLQKAGIEILPPSPEVGLYVVIVNVASAGPEGAYIAMHVQTSLMQIVNLSRDITLKTEAQTWPSLGQSRFGVVSIAIAKSAVERAVKDQAATFAADFKAANPKTLTAEHADPAERNKNEAKQ